MITCRKKRYCDKDYYSIWQGLSTDYKPIENVCNGSEFYEIDTGLIYYYDEENKVWINTEMGAWKPKSKFKGTVYKYCFWHNLTVSLYKLKENGNPLLENDYETNPAFTTTTKLDRFPDNTTAYADIVPFTIEGYDMSGHTYKLKITTTNAIDYIHLGLTLTQDNTDGSSGEDSYTWTIKNRIFMIPGDAAGGNSIDNSDLSIVEDFAYGNRDWGRTLPENAKTDSAGWGKSVYNPNCLAGRANVNGDDSISIQDIYLVKSYMGKTLADNDPFPGLIGDK